MAQFVKFRLWVPTKYTTPRAKARQTVPRSTVTGAEFKRKSDKSVGSDLTQACAPRLEAKGTYVATLWLKDSAEQISRHSSLGQSAPTLMGKRTVCVVRANRAVISQKHCTFWFVWFFFSFC